MTGAEATHKGEKDGLDEVPIFGATGEESYEREILAFEPVDVDNGKIAATRSGDVETETILGGIVLAEFCEGSFEKVADADFAIGLAMGLVFAKELEDLRFFHVK